MQNIIDGLNNYIKLQHPLISGFIVIHQSSKCEINFKSCKQYNISLHYVTDNKNYKFFENTIKGISKDENKLVKELEISTITQLFNWVKSPEFDDFLHGNIKEL